MLFNSCFAKLWHAFALLVLQYIPAIYPLAKEKCFLSCVNECCDILFFIFLPLSASCWFSQHFSSSFPSSRRSSGKRCAPYSGVCMQPSGKQFWRGDPTPPPPFLHQFGISSKTREDGSARVLLVGLPPLWTNCLSSAELLTRPSAATFLFLLHV